MRVIESGSNAVISKGHPFRKLAQVGGSAGRSVQQPLCESERVACPAVHSFRLCLSRYAQPFDGPALRAGVCRCHCDRFLDFFACAFDRWTRRSALSGVLPRVQAASSRVHLGPTVPDRRPRRRRKRPTRPRTVPPRPAQPATATATATAAAAAAAGGRARRGDWRNGDRSEDQLECPPAGQRGPDDATSSCPCCCCCTDDEKVETSQARPRSPSPPPPPPASRRFETETTAACPSRRRFASCPDPAKASLAPRRERQDVRGGRSLRRVVRRGRRRRVEGQSPEEVVSDTRRRGEARPVLILEYVQPTISLMNPLS